jgi:hypothetical protein
VERQGRVVRRGWEGGVFCCHCPTLMGWDGSLLQVKGLCIMEGEGLLRWRLWLAGKPSMCSWASCYDMLHVLLLLIFHHPVFHHRTSRVGADLGDVQQHTLNVNNIMYPPPSKAPPTTTHTLPTLPACPLPPVCRIEYVLLSLNVHYHYQHTHTEVCLPSLLSKPISDTLCPPTHKHAHRCAAQASRMR